MKTSKTKQLKWQTTKKKKIKLKKLSEIISRCWEQTIKLDFAVEKKGRWFVLGQRIKQSCCQTARWEQNQITFTFCLHFHDIKSYPDRCIAIWINCLFYMIVFCSTYICSTCISSSSSGSDVQAFSYTDYNQTCT